MTAHPDLAAVAALIGERARAAMLVELLSGQALTASELAARADIAPSTASEHLARLAEGGLITCVAQGRHRYYRLAGPEIARLLEMLGQLAQPAHPAPARDRFESELAQRIRFARSCYDHLAGWLGVAVLDAVLARGLLEPTGRDFQLTSAGEAWFTAFGVEPDAVRRARRAFARACLDMTERRPHLAGALGAALLARLQELGWIERLAGERAVLLTPLGLAGLRTSLGVQVQAGAQEAGPLLTAR